MNPKASPANKATPYRPRGRSLGDGTVSLLCRALTRAFPQRRGPAARRPASVLVIKPCCLGDVLMATPAIAALRRALPQAHLAAAVGRWAQPALKNNPHLDEVVDCGWEGNLGSPREYVRLVRRLRRDRYGAAAVLDRSPLLTSLPLLAGIPQRAGLDSDSRGFSLTQRVPCPPDRHEARLYLDVAQALVGEGNPPPLCFVPTPEDRAWAGDTLAPSGEGPRLVLLPGGGQNPGTSLPSKRWPAERYGRLAQLALEQDLAVIIAGGPGDLAAAQEVLHAAGAAGEGRLLDITGQTSVGQLGAVLAASRLVVGNDSGPLHLAVAVGTPVVGLYGPTSPQNYGPFDNRSVALYSNADCSPCFGAGAGPPPACDHRCLEAIGVEQVWRAVEGLMAP